MADRSHKLDYGQSHKHSVADAVLKRGGTPILFALLTDSKKLISSVDRSIAGAKNSSIESIPQQTDYGRSHKHSVADLVLAAHATTSTNSGSETATATAAAAAKQQLDLSSIDRYCCSSSTMAAAKLTIRINDRDPDQRHQQKQQHHRIDQ